ncbi:hypothetical protein DC094_09930 [Pelagibaculum spongiae]|uniref:Uncharacterized protein n=1 Tax=Pelagibaculum spongiae TaxID=2080658 RepID=A0A2V1GY99_9GAMM|nr:hypothetical protein DC094_09930 [Pelagibaculum spongiae]
MGLLQVDIHYLRSKAYQLSDFGRIWLENESIVLNVLILYLLLSVACGGLLRFFNWASLLLLATLSLFFILAFIACVGSLAKLWLQSRLLGCVMGASLFIESTIAWKV